MTATFTSDFHHEFEQERSRWLRRRFLWYCGVTLGLSLLGVLAGAIAIVVALAFGKNLSNVTGPPAASLVGAVPGVISISLYVWAFLYVRKRLLSREKVLRIVYWLIVANGVISIISGAAQVEVMSATLERVAEARAAERAAASAAETDTETADAADLAEPVAPAESAEAAEQVAEMADEPQEIYISQGGVRVGRSSADMAGALVGFGGFFSIFFTHLFACLFLPWTPRESIRPIIPLVLLNAVVTLIYMGSAVILGATIIALSPLVAAPGAAICWWRHSRFRDRFHHTMLRGRYQQMKQELTDARKIHEALFPKPVADGDVRFDFRYQPMRQIGGDFLYVHRFPAAAFGGDPGSEALSVVIIDVTGHGIPAALTVNRLYGELERLFAEDPDVEPGEVLSALNRYVHLTLATHSVYATAICLRADPASNRLDWASGGHPPAFLRAVDGSVEQLESTSFVLGACHGAEFHHGQRSIRFGPGDTLIAYTDGATEARNERGAMLRVDGLQKVIAGLSVKALATGGWCDAVIQEVDRHRFGPPADDTLIVELWRPLQPRPRATPATSESKPRTIEV